MWHGALQRGGSFTAWQRLNGRRRHRRRHRPLRLGQRKEWKGDGTELALVDADPTVSAFSHLVLISVLLSLVFPLSDMTNKTWGSLGPRPSATCPELCFIVLGYCGPFLFFPFLFFIVSVLLGFSCMSAWQLGGDKTWEMSLRIFALVARLNELFFVTVFFMSRRRVELLPGPSLISWGYNPPCSRRSFPCIPRRQIQRTGGVSRTAVIIILMCDLFMRVSVSFLNSG